jgi:hypothetical protein
VDVDEIVRGQRRRQALEALEFERDREIAVLRQIEEVLTELEGSRIDQAAFARMSPDDVGLVRSVLEPGSDETDDELDVEELLASESPAEIRREREAELVRLEGVIADARSRRQALERYLEALDANGRAPGDGQVPPE